MDHPPHPTWRTRLASAGHYIAALVLLLKAVSYFDYPTRPWLFIVLCLAGAAVIGGITFFHHALESRWPWVTSLIYFTECAVCIVLAVRTHLGGKEGLPYAWGVAAVMLAVQGALVVRRALSHTPPGATPS